MRSETQEQHDIGWAVAQMKQGKKVRRAGQETKWGVSLDGFLYRSYGGQDHAFTEAMDVTYLLATDWKLYEPEEEGHDFHWALEQIKAGKGVKRKAWGDCGISSCGAWGATAIEATVWHNVNATDWVLA